MVKQNRTEVWLRGPLGNFPGLLEPVAHALLQAREEVEQLVTDFPDSHLWQKPSGVASVGFHLQHLTGVLARLLTYARGEALNDEQLQRLAEEGKVVAGRSSVADLIRLFDKQVDAAIEQLRTTDQQTLTEQRLVGRAGIPSTVIGLLFHAAEHTMRHTGQLLVTVKVIKDGLKSGL